MISSVASRLVASSWLISTTAGWPRRVMVTRSSRRATSSTRPLSLALASARGTVFTLLQELQGGLLEELRRKAERLLVDPLVPAVEHFGEVLERDAIAHETVAVRGHALAAEEARVCGAHDQERDRLGARNELL